MDTRPRNHRAGGSAAAEISNRTNQRRHYRPINDPLPFVQRGQGDEPTNYRYEEPIPQQTQTILDAVAEARQQITEIQAVPAEVQEIKQILQKQEGRWASFVRSLKQFINLIQ